MAIATTTETNSRAVALFALDRQAAGAEIDMHALRLVTVLVKLVAEHGDGYRKRADDKIKRVGAGHD